MPPAAALEVAGTLLVASLFWWSGVFDLLATWPDVVGYVATRGVPLPMLAAAGATAIEILAPATLLVPRLRSWAALVLAAYCLLTATLFHDFWTLAGADRAAQLLHFMKNLALAGALLMVAARPVRP